LVQSHINFPVSFYGQTCALRARTVFSARINSIRAQATIRADGFMSAQVFANTCALRARTAFSARINGIRSENAVVIKTIGRLTLFLKQQDHFHFR